MGLLDWFRPAWKHSRPEVRREAVAALGAEDGRLLSELARRDPDAEVRRLALRKVSDVETLSACAESDPDERLKTAARERLDELRLREALGAPDETRARLAIGRLRSARSLVEVATRAESAITRRTALDRIEDQAALAELVRGAADPALRLLALDRLSEPKLLKNLALHDAPREIQLRAVERLDDLPSLEVVAQRAQLKSVRAAAAARVRERKPQAPVRDKKQEAAREADAQRARLLAEAEERRRRALEEQQRADQTRAALARQQAEAARAAEAAKPVDPAIEARREDELRRREEERRRREEERQRRDEERQRRDEEKARREADRAQKQAERDGEERRYVEALAPHAERLEALASSEDRRALDEALKAAREAPQLRGRAAVEVEAVRARFEAARSRAAARLAELRDAETWRRWANVPKFEALIKQAEALLADDSLEPRAAAQGLKALQSEWKALGAAPRERADALWARFKAVADKIYERASAGFAVQDEERAANLERKKALCERAEAVEASSDWKATAELLKSLQEEWKAVGPVPKDEADAVWQRFRGACDRFFERRKAAYAETEGERLANLATLVELCEQAEALKSSTDWRGAADRLKGLQAAWKEVGAAGRTRAEADEVWQRFRSACDHFFERRKAVFAEEDDKRKANLGKKEALCARAEALADGDEVVDPDATIRTLMQEWKALGPVPREQVDALWSRFGAACDKIRNPAAGAEADAPGAAAEGPQFENRPLEALAEKLRS